MPVFRDVVARDLRVFTNPREFGDIHVFEVQAPGTRRLVRTQVPAVIDSSEYAEDGGIEALHRIEAVIYVAQGQLPRLPRPGSQFRLDGKVYRCTSLGVEQGMNLISATRGEPR